MMDTDDIIVLIITGTVGLFILVSLIFLIVKRVKDKKKETFERREN